MGGNRMKKLILAATAAAALALAGTAAAALVPWTFVGAGATCSPTSTFSGGVLHLSKPCTTEANASAGATITGVSGQTFTSASFTLANAAQCQSGSPRFNVVTLVTTLKRGEPLWHWAATTSRRPSTGTAPRPTPSPRRRSQPQGTKSSSRPARSPRSTC